MLLRLPLTALECTSNLESMSPLLDMNICFQFRAGPFHGGRQFDLVRIFIVDMCTQNVINIVIV